MFGRFPAGERAGTECSNTKARRRCDSRWMDGQTDGWIDDDLRQIVNRWMDGSVVLTSSLILTCVTVA